MSNRPPKDPSEGGTKEFLAFPKTEIGREVFDRRIESMRTYPAQRPVSRGPDSSSEEDTAKAKDNEGSRRNVRPARSQNYDADAESVADEDNERRSLVDIPIVVRAPTGEFRSSSASLPREPRAGRRLPGDFRGDGQEDDSPDESSERPPLQPPPGYNGPGIMVARGLSQIGAQTKERREAGSAYQRRTAAVVDEEAEDEVLYGNRRDA